MENYSDSEKPAPLENAPASNHKASFGFLGVRGLILLVNSGTGFARIFRFIISGSAGAATNLGILYVLTDIFGIWYLFSSICSTSAAMIVSFTMQKFFTFRNFERDNVHRQATLYLVVSLSAIGLNTLLMYLFVSIIGIHYLLAQIAASLIVAIFSYFMYGKIFKMNI